MLLKVGMSKQENQIAEDGNICLKVKYEGRDGTKVEKVFTFNFCEKINGLQ